MTSSGVPRPTGSLTYRGRSEDSPRIANGLRVPFIDRETFESAHIDVASSLGGPRGSASDALREEPDAHNKLIAAQNAANTADRQALIAKLIADFLNIITDVALIYELLDGNKKLDWQAWAAFGSTCAAFFGFIMCLLALVCRISNKGANEVQGVKMAALVLSSIADTGLLVVGIAGGLNTIEMKDLPLMTSTAASLITIVGRFLPYMW